MNDVSFKGLYRLRVATNYAGKGLYVKLQDEFAKEGVKAIIQHSYNHPYSQVLKGDSAGLIYNGVQVDKIDIVSYGTPEQDFKVLQEVFGKRLVGKWVLEFAQKIFDKDYMWNFKLAAQKKTPFTMPKFLNDAIEILPMIKVKN